jgi:peptidyl-tRNA hydrolase
MPVFMIERRYAELMEPTADGAAEINAINDEEDVRWLLSFLSADRRKSYCLYEAESADALLRAAERAGLPADVITELGHRVLPDGSLVGVSD